MCFFVLHMHCQASPRPFHQIRKVLEQEVGPAAMTLFSHFDEQATAAASLAQVRARPQLAMDDAPVSRSSRSRSTPAHNDMWIVHEAIM